MFTRILLAMAAFIGISAPAAAQECQRSHAPTVTFAEATNADRPSRHCVEIEGIAVGGTLYEDERAPYRRERIENDPSSGGAELGFHHESYFDSPTRVRVVGRVSDCATESSRGERGERVVIDMDYGYCHDSRGRIILALHVEPLGPATLTRQLPGQSDDLGDLVPLAASDVRQQMEAAATRFLDAVRARDEAAMRLLHGGAPTGRRAEREIEQVLNLLDDPQSPFAPVRAGGPIITEFFGWKPPLWAEDVWHAWMAGQDDFDAIACFSARPDAAALWPIDSRDADNISGRPYACTRIHIAGRGEGASVSFDTEQVEGGAVEPIHQP